MDEGRSNRHWDPGDNDLGQWLPLRVFLRKRCMGRTHAMEEIACGRLKTVRKGSHHVVTDKGAREYDALVELEAEQERTARAARKSAA